MDSGSANCRRVASRAPGGELRFLWCKYDAFIERKEPGEVGTPIIVIFGKIC
jgi:hypothetical protein